mmetsp:Transcript_20291/g.61131  ORF Transcript_20291/g.61131 Transcript_20291/m.61131 type:complete len:543 (+) Transcript_20291:2432-4060(+)|eukprot:CAMPEP_0206150838 /NCGR_PEP_ID=MMETSP1473-20131121/38513_1 /ASSEMBLY_ACC=CAM_ASM_001109 /TAXON_ID=1461547 /ORGANISM="Stichococcus sp, Strain RCC1054" /LENGTH=542 /DNA_ID=CAMNT_0053548367 /DNA_START=2412 /DNA_END=4040 /DNA_ORIENTATION=+
MVRRPGAPVSGRALRPLIVVPLVVLAVVYVWETGTGRSLAGHRFGAENDVSNYEPASESLGPESDDPQVLKQRAHALEKQLKAAAAVDLKEHEEHEKWRLTHAMMYWTHSNPVPRPPGHALYPGASGEGVKYITWEQDTAGLNNVRLQVENLVMMAALFRRTLVMPDHLAGPMDHQHALPTSFSDFFDFTDLSRWISIISMDEYLTHRGVAADSELRRDRGQLQQYLRGEEHNETVYPKWDANGEVLAVPDVKGASMRQNPSLEEWLKVRSYNNRPALEYWSGYQKARTMHFKTGDGFRLFGHVAGFMYFPTQGWQDYYYAQMRDHFHYRRDLVHNASEVVYHLRKKFGKHFNAVHDRVGDFEKQFPNFIVTGQEMSDNLLLALGGGNEPLYIASKDKDGARFAPLKAAFPTHVFGSEVLKEVLPGVHPMLQAAIEQLVCSVATRFVGTYGSTFTANIHRMRGHHHPDLVPDKDTFYINSPRDKEEYKAVVANPKQQTRAVWWPQPGIQTTTDSCWTREWFFTWTFEQSEVMRDSKVFQVVR